MSQSDLMSANGRKQQLETELSTMRSELRDHKQQIRDANTQVSDLQRQLQDANANKNRLTDKIHELDRVPFFADSSRLTPDRLKLVTDIAVSS
ncbi:unnamed protein product [Anisakis simplex]|uniref:Chromosome partition protein Smc n=1 Tax=Anisakis simplex TaxID=6269 RepID=A0A0M3JLT0_ANISI|nr:unnamed protein product [Anisakis simplex]